MSKDNGCIQTRSIMENNLKCVEITDLYDTGEVRWFVKDSFDNTTPVFDNSQKFIYVNQKSCMFLGRFNGNTKLYVVKESNKKEEKIYDEIELEGNPIELIDINKNKAIVRSLEGVYFFDKENLTRSSEMFDRLTTSFDDKNKVYTFEKNLRNKDNEVINKIIGNVSIDGKIGNFIYDDSINCIKSTPKLVSEDSYDQFDYSTLYSDFYKLNEKKKKEKEEFIQKLVKINRNVTKY